MQKSKIILVAGALIIFSSLLGREFPVAGYWTAITVIGLCFLFFIGVTLKCLKTRTASRRILPGVAAISCALMIVLGGALLKGEINYFLLLVVFAGAWLFHERLPGTGKQVKNR